MATYREHGVPDGMYQQACVGDEVLDDSDDKARQEPAIEVAHA